MITSSKINSILLTLLIFAASFFSDRFIPNSLLTIPLLIASITSALITQFGIIKLKEQKIGQIIRREGPKQHYNKSGTPTMGGIFIIPVGLIVGSLISINGESSEKLIAICGITLAFMVIGGLDDWKSLSNQTNKGLNAQEKINLEAIVAIVFLYFSASQGWIDSSISLAFGISLPLGILIWPLSLFVFLAQSNATNLTDGLDGLASGCGALTFAGLAIQLMLRGNNGDPVIAGFCMAMAGAWLGFLLHNNHPARIFMGDAGSLAMGGSLSAVALLSDSLWPLLIMGGVFLIESLSVIFQVIIFKITKILFGKGYRIFRMAPLHHHFEIQGTKEYVVVKYFWLSSVFLVILGLIFRPNIL